MLNEVKLIGHLGQDAEVKMTQNGKEVASLSIATKESWTDQQGQRKEKTEWHRCIFWNPGKVAQYLTKGKLVMVEGKLETRMWEKDGHKNYTTEIIVSKVILLTPNQQSEEGERRGPQRGAAIPPAQPQNQGYRQQPAGNQGYQRGGGQSRPQQNQGGYGHQPSPAQGQNNQFSADDGDIPF